ncbi:hypothetical protein [Pseudoclavibacter helvolus]|uniref:hypothetical protein n=1 Tax=Pseudoclavibacter helvolus TaxID=255205 RepID=UPI003C793610
MDFFLNALWSLIPTVIIGVAFFWILTSILSGDRRERAMADKIEREERARLGLPQPDANS